MTRWLVAIIIPARDESASVAACLESALAASDAVSARAETWLVVVADRCTDDTAAVSRRILARRGEVIETSQGSAGSARRLGAALALQRWNGQAPGCIWLANTDADSRVPVDWLQRQLDYADSGYQGVAGTVSIGQLWLNQLDVSALIMSTYAIHADGTHPHVHGANLGCRADAYLQAGGWSDLALAEDHCLWRRLKAHSCRLISSSLLPVQTSARLQGRASGGFADNLRLQWQQLHG